MDTEHHYHKKTILIAEDDRDIREALEDVLKNEGYAVDTVKDGKEALEYVDHRTRPYDLIILDLLMPLNGHEASMILKARGCRSPILLISGAPALILKEYPLEFVEAFMPKPPNLDHLLTIVESLTLKKLRHVNTPGPNERESKAS